LGSVALGTPSTLEHLVTAAYRQELLWRISTFFRTSIDGPVGAEKHFRNGLPELIQARDRALTILSDTKGI